MRSNGRRWRWRPGHEHDVTPHWHGYWLGPRDGARRFELRWQPPIAVGVEDVTVLSAVVRPVR